MIDVSTLLQQLARVTVRTTNELVSSQLLALSQEPLKAIGK